MSARRLVLVVSLGAGLAACDGDPGLGVGDGGPGPVVGDGGVARGGDAADAGSGGLPNWAADWERPIQELTPLPTVPDGGPPPAGLRLPAEYEPTRAVVIAYTDYPAFLGQIAVHVAAAGAEVWAIGGPGGLTDVPAAQYVPLSFPFDSVWTRDYGPVGIEEATGALGIVDHVYRHHATRPRDDAIPCRVADYAGAVCHPSPLVLDGGNLMTDGRGNLFMTRRTYVWNSSRSEAEVDQLLRDHLGVTTIHKLDYATDGSGPADGTGHIDMFAKLVADCTVLVAESSTAPYAAPLEAAATYFQSLECAPGQSYQVLRLPAWEAYWTWYTYTNSLIVNGTVLVPSYAGGQDGAAVAVYQEALPGATIVLIPSDEPITSGGSIHCVTKEIPAP